MIKSCSFTLYPLCTSSVQGVTEFFYVGKFILLLMLFFIDPYGQAQLRELTLLEENAGYEKAISNCESKIQEKVQEADLLWRKLEVGSKALFLHATVFYFRNIDLSTAHHA